MHLNIRMCHLGVGDVDDEEYEHEVSHVDGGTAYGLGELREAREELEVAQQLEPHKHGREGHDVGDLVVHIYLYHDVGDMGRSWHDGAVQRCTHRGYTYYIWLYYYLLWRPGRWTTQGRESWSRCWRAD